MGFLRGGEWWKAQRCGVIPALFFLSRNIGWPLHLGVQRTNKEKLVKLCEKASTDR